MRQQEADESRQKSIQRLRSIVHEFAANRGVPIEQVFVCSGVDEAGVPTVFVALRRPEITSSHFAFDSEPGSSPNL
jgi:hypothetical protein